MVTYKNFSVQLNFFLRNITSKICKNLPNVLRSLNYIKQSQITKNEEIKHVVSPFFWLWASATILLLYKGKAGS